MTLSPVRFGYHAQIQLVGPHPGQSPLHEDSHFTTMDFAKHVLEHTVQGVLKQVYDTTVGLRWSDYHGTLMADGTKLARLEVINHRANGSDPVLYGTADSKGRINILALDTKAPGSYRDTFVSTAVSNELRKPTSPVETKVFLSKLVHWFVDRRDNLRDAVVQGANLTDTKGIQAAYERLLGTYGLKPTA